MKSKNRIGFHCGNGGNHSGLGDWIRAQNMQGLAVNLKSVDNYGICQEAVNVGSEHGIANVVGFRISKGSGNSQLDYEVPKYILSPKDAAIDMCDHVKEHLPPEFQREYVWLELINEPRSHNNPGDIMYGNMNAVDWLGEFMYECAIYMNSDGYKICGPSFNSGEPRENDYDQPGFVKYLRYCADNPLKAAVALHEYNFGWATNWDTVIPHTWGRFQRVIAASDTNGIPRTYSIFVTEWGGSHDFAPTWNNAKTWTNKYNELIAKFPQVKMVAAWCLQRYGTSNIHNQVQTWIKPFWSLYDEEFDEGEHPNPTFLGTVPQPDQTITEFLWDKGRSLVCVNPNSDAALQKKMTEDNYSVSGPEKWFTFPGTGDQWAVQPADLQDSNAPRVYAAKVPHWDDILTITDGGIPDHPLFGISMGHLFKYRYALTSKFNAPRTYANKKHEGGDFDIIGGWTNNLVSVLCTYDGVVSHVGNSEGGYGKYVVVKHNYNNTEFFTWYGHLDMTYVTVGTALSEGEAVGEVGATGNAFGEHVHYNIQVPNFGAPPSEGYAVDWVIDPEPYIPDVSGLPMYDEMPSGYDMAEYFLPPYGRTHSDIFILSNNWGADPERVQLQSPDGFTSYIVKNQQYEKRVVGSDKVWFQLDTSPGQNRYYTVSSPTGWIPRYWNVGDSFTRIEDVKWYHKDGCAFIQSSINTSSILFSQVMNSKLINQLFGDIPLPQDVIALEWHPTEGGWDERYYYAKGLGLVKWEKHDGRSSEITELIPLGDQQNNVMEFIDCL